MSVTHEFTPNAATELESPAPPLKVLVLSPSLASAGGIQRYTAALVRALQEELGETLVRCSAIASGNGKQRPRLSPLSKLRFVLHAMQEAVDWKPNLVICTHIALGPIGWLVSRMTSAPYWVVVYGIEAWRFLSPEKKHALRRAQRIIFISNFAGRHVQTLHGADAHRMMMLPPCTAETVFKTEAPLNAAATENERVLLMVARMAASERYKGHEVVLRSLPPVVQKHPNVKCIFVGDGDDRGNLEDLAQELGISERVCFAGNIDESGVATLYRRSEVFVLPARTNLDPFNPKGEGFGIVFLEAMAFGLPVIGPNTGAPCEFIRHGQDGLLVNPEDPAAVAEAILTLLNNPEMAQRMGQAGKQWVNANYSYARFRDRLRAILVSSLPSQGVSETDVTHAHS